MIYVMSTRKPYLGKSMYAYRICSFRSNFKRVYSGSVLDSDKKSVNNKKSLPINDCRRSRVKKACSYGRRKGNHELFEEHLGSNGSRSESVTVVGRFASGVGAASDDAAVHESARRIPWVRLGLIGDLSLVVVLEIRLR